MILKNQTYHLSQNVTIAEFGDGDIIVADGYDDEKSGRGYLLLANSTPNEIGTPHPYRDHRSPEEIEHDVIFIFSNTDSLDVVINALQRTRERMIQPKEGDV